LIAKPPRWYMQQSALKRAELDLIMKGPKNWEHVDDKQTVVTWSGEGFDEEDEEEQVIGLFDQLTVAVIPLDTVPISFATLLLPPSHPRSIDFWENMDKDLPVVDPNHVDVV
jgi:hypothetical protein